MEKDIYEKIWEKYSQIEKLKPYYEEYLKATEEYKELLEKVK
jgi:GTP1/Obg family GTP-binding protein